LQRKNKLKQIKKQLTISCLAFIDYVNIIEFKWEDVTYGRQTAAPSTRIETQFFTLYALKLFIVYQHVVE